MKSLDGLKSQNTNATPVGRDVALLEYKLAHTKKDVKKTVIITALIVGILAFTGGAVFTNIRNAEVNALRDSNYSLRKEADQLKAQTPSAEQ